MKQIYMKFSLLLIGMVLGLNAWATDVVVATCDFTAKTAKNSAYTGTWTYGDYSVSHGANNNGGWAYIKLGAKSTNLDNPCYIATTKDMSDDLSKITVSIPAGSLSKTGMDVTSWGVKVYSDADMKTEYDYVKGGTIAKTAGTFDFTPSDGKTWSKSYRYVVTFTLENTTTTNGIVLVDKITYYKNVETGKTETTTSFPSDSYTALIGGDAFAAPTATVTGGDNLTPTYSSSETSVATVDESTGVVTLVAPGTTTITASYAGDETYEESSASYTLTVGKVYANIQKLQAGVQTTSLPMKLTLSNVTVTGVNSNNAYISDGTYGAVIYTSGHGLTAGQTISGTLEASCQIYNGIAEITNYSSKGLTITDGTLGDAPVVTIASLTSANESKYCKLENVAYDATKATFSDGANTIAYYDGLKKTPSLTDGKNYDVVGIVSYRKTSSAETLQFFPISVEEKAADVEAPELSLTTGTYKQGSANITITDATEGATIYYTLDGTDPTTADAPTEYTGAISITETSTITAAAKNDDTWSNKVSATYTIIPLYKDIKTAKAAMTATDAKSAVDCYITLKNAVVTAIANSNYYIEDETAGMVIYNTSSTISDKLTKAGLVLNGDLKCAGYIYNGLHEYTKNFDFTDVEITEGGTIPCTEITIADLLEDGAMDKYESMRMKIVDATVSSTLSSRKATIAQGDNSIQVYEKVQGKLAKNGLSAKNINLTVIGYPGMSNETKQFNILTTDDININDYSRSTAKGHYGTICLPYVFTATNATIYSVESIGTDENKYVNLKEATPEAGKPYIYQATADNPTFAYTSGDVVSAPVANEPLTGVFTDATPADGTYVLQCQNSVYGFYQVDSSKHAITVPAWHAYLTVPDTQAKVLNLPGEDATAIDAVNALTANSVQSVYSTNGARQSGLQKGMNIVKMANGKTVKILVK